MKKCKSPRFAFRQAGQLNKQRILLADDHPNVLEMVTRLLEPTFEVVGRVANGEALLEAAARLKPDVIVTDISMSALNGIEAVSKLKESGCRSKIIFLTVHADPDYIRACLATRADAYVIKAMMAPDLIRAIQEALIGHTFISPSAHFQDLKADFRTDCA